MTGLPRGWTTATLGDLFEIARGGSPRPIKDYLTREPDGINWVKIGDATASDKYIFETKEKIRPEGLSKTRLVKPGDFILSNSMSFGRPYIMRTTGCIHDGWLVLSDRSGVLDQDYLYRFLGSQIAYRQFDQLAAGSTVRNLNSDLVRTVLVLVPPLAEQRRIVAKLDQVMARTARARAELARIPALIAHHKRTILAAASVGALTADFRDRSKVKKWTPTNVERIATVVFDGPFGSHLKSDDYSENGVRVVRLENIGHLRFIEAKRTYVPPEKYASLTRHSLYAGDVLFSSFVDEEVRVCVLPADIDQQTINKADCFCVRVDANKCDANFLAYRLACHSTYEVLEDAVHGATRPRISLKQLRGFSFDLPSLPEQREIVRRVQAAFAWLDKVAHEHAQATLLLDHLDQALLAKAFRGELVPQDPADEPAAALLARIRAEREGAAPARSKRKARAT